MGQNNLKNPIEDWRKRKAEVKTQNKKLINKLSKLNDKKLKGLTFEIHENVFKKVDCLDCANCCKSIPPIVNETDARRIAKHLGMKVNDFKAQYLKVDEDMDMVMNLSPCPFLQQDNRCLIYEYRPKACRKYPHTDEHEFGRNLKLHTVNANYCPAVFHMLEELKRQGV